MILNAAQLRALQQRNDEELRKGSRAPHGYPAHTIRDLLHTVESLKREKKKWKKLAQDRGKALEIIREATDKAMTNGDTNGAGNDGPVVLVKRKKA